MLYHFIPLVLLIPIAHATELDTVVVKSTHQSSMRNIVQPVLVVDEEALKKSQAKSLGELLAQQPGISNASFGPGVGRPVLRGLSGSRVKTLVNGQDSSDLSAMSSDHAPMVEITNSEQVEVILGPATVLYGSGAIGGIVNVLDRSIHQSPVHQVQGSVKAGISSNDHAQVLAAEINAGNGLWAMHLNGFNKSSNDYHSSKGRVENSDTKSQGGGIGISRTSDEYGFIGMSLHVIEQDYAVPNPNDSATRVRPKQTRAQLSSAWLNPIAGIDSWQTQVSHIDYTHDELTLPMTEGLFDKESFEINSKVQHASFAGWQGTIGIHFSQQQIKLCHDHSGCSHIPDYSDQNWKGEQGNLFSQKEGFLFVHDTPMPITKSTNLGYFLVENKPWKIDGVGAGLFELGARIDTKTITADPVSIQASSRRSQEYYEDNYFLPMTFSVASIWNITNNQNFSLSLSRAQRAPDAEEMYWNGDHHATFSYQLDNINLHEETAYTADIVWNITGENHFIRTAVYHYLFNDYIYNDLKNTTDPYHGHAVYRHEQKDARFVGFEFSWEQQITNTLSSVINLDCVRAELLAGEDKYIPRLPPASASLTVNWQKNNWLLAAENHWLAEQDRVSRNETSTSGFQRLDLKADYNTRLFNKELTTSLAINNVFNSAGTSHVSYLKEFAPNTGRNIQLQTHLYF
mgnify:CR=1 FL=1